MIINKIEDVKNVSLFEVKFERWHIYPNNEYYLLMIVDQFNFEHADLDSFDEYSDKIIGNSNEEFVNWLIDLSEEEGRFISEILEDMGVYGGSYIFEKYFSEETSKRVIDDSELLDNEDFQLANAQPYADNECFSTVEKATDFICESYPFFKD